MAAIDTVAERVANLIATEFELEPADVRPQADLYDDLGLDSLDAIDLVVAIERAFAFKVEEGAARRLRTVGQVQEFVAGRLNPA